MTRSRILRPLSLATAGTVALGLAGPLASPATAVDRAAASSSSQWLANQLDNGRFTNPLGGGDDEGLMIDALYAMHASGDADLAAPIVDVLDSQDGVLNFISWNEWWPGEGANERIGGATAKTLLAAQVAGADPHDFGGLDLVEETKGVIITAEDFEPGGRFAADGAFPGSGNVAADVGRVTDYGPYQNFNNANTFGQSLATIALARAGELTQPVVDALLWQQCPEGFFRIFYSTNNVTQQRESCADGRETPAWEPGNPHPPMVNASPPDGDTTGLGLSALLAAKKSGVSALDDDIDRAVQWLVANQQPGGGWGGGVGTEAPNTNSTGLIVQALAEAGAPATVVQAGEDYLRSAQATASDDSGNALADDIGAIAYNPGDYTSARGGGIGNLDAWIRAGAQASLGLSQVGFWDLSAGPDQAPEGVDVEVTTPAGTPLPITLTATDPEGGLLEWEVTEPANGTVSGTAPALTYTPDNGFRGTDAFDVTVTDPSSNTATYTVTIEVTNRAPLAPGTTVSTPSDTPAQLVLPASDPDADPFTVTFTQPANGSVSGSGSTVTYVPDAGFAGTDVFTYTATDDRGATTTGTARIVVGAANRPPTAEVVRRTTQAGAPVLVTLAGSDPDGDQVSYTHTEARHGTVTGIGRDLTYTPDAGFSGSDYFDYTATDGRGGSVTSVVLIRVNAVPGVQDLTAQTRQGQSVPIELPGTDPDGDDLRWTHTQPGHGTLTGTGRTLTYTPSAGFTGVDSFDYTVDDGAGGTSSATVTVEVALPAVAVQVEASTAYLMAGRSTTVRATGLAPGEAFRIWVGNELVGRGTADASGAVVRSVLVPAQGRETRRQVIVTGSLDDRTGATRITVLAPKDLRVRAKKNQVRAGGRQRVVVSGLAPGESVTVRMRGRSLRGSANADGVFASGIAVGRKAGRVTVRVRGEFGSRRGSDVFRVVVR